MATLAVRTVVPRISPLIATASLCAACVGNIGGPSTRADGSGAAATPSGSGGSSSSPGSTSSGEKPDSELTCDQSQATVGLAPLRRLARTEYLNTVRALFPGVALPTLVMTPDKAADGFDNHESTQTATAPLVEEYHTNAGAVAGAVEQDLGAVTQCAATDTDCVKSYALDLAARAFRRPLSSDEAATFADFVSTQASAFGLTKAAGLFVEGLLQSANFIYRPELGVEDPARADALRLTGYELATRLSYFITASQPDSELLAAAAAGTLDSASGVETEARRLLASDAARASLTNFHAQWLELNRIKTMSRDTTLFPLFDTALPATMYDATERFVMNNFWDGGGRIDTLLSSPKAYVNDALAPVYGLPSPGSDELVLVDLDPAERAGLLTQAGLLASMAHEKFDAPILRGVFVLRHLLCAPPDAPPPNVPDIPPAEDGDGPKTTRQRVEDVHVSSAACKGCHEQIDGIGFAFDNYDAIGQYRTTENGLPVDSTGAITGMGDADGTFDGAVALSSQLAGSERVTQCAARHLFRYAYGRSETVGDQCAILDAVTASGGDMKELVVELVLRDNFRYRPRPE